jgi:hypothetical protein
MKMNLKRILLIILTLSQMVTLLSQKVEFTYDDNGNRHTRTITVQELQSKSVEFPIINPKNLKTTENAMAKGLNAGESSQNDDAKSLADSTRERISPAEGEIVTRVYPNPNKGLIKIDISNMPLNSISELRLYDLSGNEIVMKKNIENHTEIDITRFIDGIYILRVKINEKTFDWKVIKNLPYNN